MPHSTDSAPSQRDYSAWFAETLQFAGKLDRPINIKPRPAPIAASLAAHAVLLALVAVSPAVDLPRNPSAYKQLIAGQEHKLVWYKFKDKLPDVSPTQSQADRRPPRAEIRIARQSIVSSPKDAPKSTQMVWLPTPEIRLPKEVQSPNILAMQLPKPVRPAIKPKEFVPPKPVERVATAKTLAAPPVPQVKMNVPNSTAALQQLAALQPPKAWKTFVAPARKIQASFEVPLLPNAPAMAADANTGKGLPQSLAALPKVYKPFVPPVASVYHAGRGVDPGGSSMGMPAPPELDAGPPVPSGLSANTLNAAVVGLNPADRLGPLPEGSRPAQFSAGPKLNPNGGTGARDGAGITVPDLMIRGGGKDTRPTLMARTTNPASPSAADSLRAASRYLTVGDIGRGAARVSSAPDPRFEGRQVYTTAIQMPNITSYVGSWLMWYADRNAVPLNAGVITPPLPHRKVDPKYIPAAADERVEGQVRLSCVIQKNGRVDLVQLVKGLDDRLDQSAIDALAKWEFTPAMRNGNPVDVDVLVEIPFRLAPRAKR